MLDVGLQDYRFTLFAALLASFGTAALMLHVTAFAEAAAEKYRPFLYSVFGMWFAAACVILAMKFYRAKDGVKKAGVAFIVWIIFLSVVITFFALSI